jgi:proteasome lid subunit RPN8/RPN11
MLEHAASAPGEEVCGLISGDGESLIGYHRVRNAATDRKVHYLMEPEDQIAVLRALRENGQVLAGIFHSHPATAAEPSATDLAQATWPGVYYFIASMDGAPPELNAFLFDGRSFHAVSLIND